MTSGIPTHLTRHLLASGFSKYTDTSVRSNASVASRKSPLLFHLPYLQLPDASHRLFLFLYLSCSLHRLFSLHEGSVLLFRLIPSRVNLLSLERVPQINLIELFTLPCGGLAPAHDLLASCPATYLLKRRAVLEKYVGRESRWYGRADRSRVQGSCVCG